MVALAMSVRARFSGTWRINKSRRDVMNKYRQFFTSGVGFTFIIVGITGVIFQFFFKNRVLEEIHGWLGVGMVTLAIAHVFQNWRPLKKHLGDRRVFILLLPILLVAAFLAFGKKETNEGMSPRAVVRKLVQASASDVAKVFGKDVNKVFASMKSDGLDASNTADTVQKIAGDNQKPAEAVLVYFAK
jgi:hypothetical protein